MAVTVLIRTARGLLCEPHLLTRSRLAIPPSELPSSADLKLDNISLTNLEFTQCLIVFQNIFCASTAIPNFSLTASFS